MARLVDISLPVSTDLPVWPGDPAISIEPAKRIARGDAANVSLLALGNHTGTHVDPPSHFIDGGRSIDQIDPAALVGPAWVVEVPDARGEIGAVDLESGGIPAEAERLLIKTPNSGTLGPGKRFREDFACLSVEAAEWCVGSGLLLVGVDYLSIERPDAPKEHPVHRTLLSAGVVIVEGLDLSGVSAGACELICLPLLVAGGDGAPARAFVRLPD
ncbi:MAG TPA: cyclase family protein [Actinomycetota bacterium]|jgi:arylformamidase